MRTIALFALLTLSSCSMECSWHSSQKPATERDETGEREPYPAPTIRGTYLYGERPFRHDYAAYAVTVVNFWSPDCPGTELEAGSLQAFAHADPDVRVIGIAPSEHDRKELLDFASRHGWTFTLLRDDGTAVAFGTDGVVPASFIVNEEGMVVAKIVNYTDWQSTEMADVIEHVRNGRLIWYERYLRREK